jgi:PAS domain S-box-containing protein
MRNNLKQYTMEIEKAKEEFKQVADSAPVMIWMAGPDKLCYFVNKGWLDFTGRTTAQETGHGWFENIHPADFDRCIHNYAASFDSRQNFYIEYRLRRYDGVYRWVGDTGTPRFGTHGEFRGYIGSCIDIHEAKMHEQRKDDFIKMASHELKTPVTSIKGYVQLLQNMYADKKEMKHDNEPPMQTSLVAIEKQVEKLTRLISDLLDLSQMETGKIELRLQAFDLCALVNETVQDFRQTTNRTIIIQKDIEDSKHCMIYADKDRIAQVLLNLLSNAVKYSDGNKDVTVRIFKTSDKNIAVSVIDKGIGIDKKEQARIFERFYRAEGKMEQTYPGFGIGLFVASEIVQWHNGTFEVESEKNKGSVFTFILPLAEKNFSDNGKDNIKHVTHSGSQ